MSTANVEAYLAEQHAAELRRKAADEQAEQDRQKYASIRDELREKRSEHHKQSGVIKRFREKQANVQNKLNQALLAVDQSWRERPDVCNYLPNDPEAVAWTSQHMKLEAERDKLIEQRNSLPQPDLLEFARLCDSITRLEYAEGNQKNKLDGSLGRVERGTMNYVS